MENTMERKQLIKEYLMNGFNCAQVVAVAFSEKVNKDKKTLLAAASGFGGGIGRQAMICGAVTGAVIVLGFDKGQTEALDSAAKELTYKNVHDFFTRFTNINGSVICRDLLNCDISTPEGLELHKKGCHTEKCFRYIETSMEILDNMLKDE
jgi:C_GCAxxG_C_C family probable redox protein